MKQKTKIIGGILCFILCILSFIGGVFFASTNKFEYKKGFAEGYIYLAKDIKTATESNPNSEYSDCKPISAMKWVDVSVCTINETKTIAVSD